MNLAELPADWVEWPHYWSIDWGFIHPICWQDWIESPHDGSIYLFRQIYRTETLVEDLARMVMEVSEGYIPRAIICDHDAGDRATFERHTGYLTLPAYKSIQPGIQAVQSRIKPLNGGPPRVFILRDSLLYKDERLAEKGLPTCTEEEMDGYIWDKKVTRETNSKKDELPVDKDNHGCLVAGTQITCQGGYKSIEDVRVGDLVLTRGGYRIVRACGMTSLSTVVTTLTLLDGRRITGTGNHPVWVKGQGWKELNTLRYGDAMLDECEFSQLMLPPIERESSLMGSFTGDTQELRNYQIGATLGPESLIGTRVLRSSMLMFGSTIREKFPLGMKYIIERGTHPKIILRILSAYPKLSIRLGTYQTQSRGLQLPGRIKRKLIEIGCSPLLRIGIALLRVGSGISRMLSMLLLPEIGGLTTALFVGTPSFSGVGLSSAPIDVNQSLEGDRGLMMLRVGVNTVGASSSLISTPKRDSAPVVVALEVDQCQRAVYNLTVDGDNPEYYANGVLVHNCDAKRYMIAFLDNLADDPEEFETVVAMSDEDLIISPY